MSRPNLNGRLRRAELQFGHSRAVGGLDGRTKARHDPADTLPVPSLLFRVEGAQPNLTDYRESERWFDYDVTADGQRFLIRQPVIGSESVDNLRVVIGWSGGNRFQP